MRTFPHIQPTALASASAGHHRHLRRDQALLPPSRPPSSPPRAAPSVTSIAASHTTGLPSYRLLLPLDRHHLHLHHCSQAHASTTHTSPPLHRHAYHRLHRHHHDRRRPLYAALPPVSPIPSPPSPSPLKSPPALTCGACWGWPRKCECTFACACPPNLRTHGNRPACACAPLPGPRSAHHSPLTTFRLVSWQVSM